LAGSAVEASGYRARSPKTKILSRDDPRCGVIPNACGALIRFEFIHGEKPRKDTLFGRERSRRALKTLAVMQNRLLIFFMYLSEISK
jgi:hypothetical protein